MFDNFIVEKKKDKGNVLVFIASSILFTLFLFFIDEGHYNFNWTQNILSFIVLLIYVIPMVLIQRLIYRALPKRLNKTDKYLASIPAGIFFGALLVISGFYLLG